MGRKLTAIRTSARLFRLLAAACLATRLEAQAPDQAELLRALANTAATFARTVPYLTATEHLSQHGRRGKMQFAKLVKDRNGKTKELKDVSIELPEEFQSHEVVSAYSFGSLPGLSGFHEIRKTITVDGDPPEQGEIRHALTLGLQRPDDGKRKELLENLEQNQLQGSVTDFGPMLLLFSESGQRNYRFRTGTLAGNERIGKDRIGKEQAFVLHYRQTAGPGVVTEFRDREEVLHPAQGRIWFRQSDLLPLRITFEADEIIAPKYILRNEADITYRPTPFGLAPELILHRQFLNQDLLVENRFQYEAYNGRGIDP